MKKKTLAVSRKKMIFLLDRAGHDHDRAGDRVANHDRAGDRVANLRLVTGRFANESFRQRPVRQRMKSIRQRGMSVPQRG